MNSRYDIVFCALPPLEVNRIYSAPAILKGAVQGSGYASRCFDFSITLFDFCNRDLNVYSKIINFYKLFDHQLDSNEQKILNNFYDYVIDLLHSIDTKYIGFSVLHGHVQRCVVDILLRIKDTPLLSKIVLGGRGISTQPSESVVGALQLSKQDLKLEFVDVLKKCGLDVNCIVGDGEEAVLEFLATGKTTTAQNHLTSLKVQLADYFDYDFSNYCWQDEPSLDVISSLGCVRDCDFCDVKKQFGSYKFKNGQEFAEELIQLQKIYNINKFIISDSLVNGGLKHFTAFMKRLAAHNVDSDNPIKWSGQYICRDLRNSSNVDEYYQLIASSGGSGLTIGAESGSNYVLSHMNKKSTVEGLFFELENFRRHQITCQLLMLNGHWSERHQDFVDHCRTIINLVPYVRAGTISAIHLGYPFELLPGTPAFNNINLITSRDHYSAHLWVARNNRGNTYKVRLLRRLIVSMLAEQLKLGVEIEETLLLQSIAATAHNYCQEINNFFKQYSSEYTTDFECIRDYQTFIDSLLVENNNVIMNVQLVANKCNTDPMLSVCINGHELFNGELVDGSHELTLTVPTWMLLDTNQLEFALTNKLPLDTEVDEQGKILRDKSIVIQSLKINNCDVVQDIDFFFEHFYYDTPDNVPSMGLWDQRVLKFNFELPFVKWYSTQSTRNRSNSYSDISQKQHCGLLSKNDYYQLLLEEVEQLVV